MTTTTSIALDPSKRRSMGLFSRPSFAASTPLHKEPYHQSRLVPKRPVSYYGTAAKGSTLIGIPVTERILTKADLNAPLPPRPTLMRPASSIVLSKLSDASYSPDSSTSSTLSSSTASSVVDEKLDFGKPDGVVLFSGEVLSTGGLLRSLRRKEYLVLTDTQLLRFRSLAKAIESFPSLNPISRINGRSTTFSTLSEISLDQSLVVLNQIVAVYEVDKTFIQVDHLDEHSGSPTSTILQLATVSEAEQWLTALCKTVRSPGYSTPPFVPKTVEFVARRLEMEKDYSPDNIMIFRVVHRLSDRKGQVKLSYSNDDISKSYSSICYLAVGVNKIHLIPLPKLTNSRSSSSLLSPHTLQSYGILTLCGITMAADADDSFTLKFRSPCRPYQTLHLASSCAAQIIQTIRHAADFLRPEWIEPSFSLDIPDKLYNEPFPDVEYDDDCLCFDRTLGAFCAAYEVDIENIGYEVVHNVSDGPRFQLYPPKKSRRARYSIVELLAVLRSLRWNEYFGSISFKGVSLEPLKGMNDSHGIDMEAYRTRTGRKLDSKGTKKTLLILELRAIAACSSKLRRLDFTDCLNSPGQRIHDEYDVDEVETGCEIVEAILPLCKRAHFTNVDWLTFSGIPLDAADLDWLVDSAVDRTCHLRGFEVARCGLSERSMNLLLESLRAQGGTLEAIDISGNPGRLNSSTLNSLGDLLSVFSGLKTLRLAGLCLASGFGAATKGRRSSSHSPSRLLNDRSSSAYDLTSTSSMPSPRPEFSRSTSALSTSTMASLIKPPREFPIIPIEILMKWKLEELDLSGTALNKETVDALSAYLASSASESLKTLYLNRCGLKAGELAVLLGCLAWETGKVRDLHLHVDQLLITPDHNKLVDAIKQGLSPSKLTMSNVDYLDEEMFRKLIKALTVNKTLRYLDLSKVFLPSDANSDTINAFCDLFAKNDTLEVLNISGGYGRIEDGRLGQGLNKAFGSLCSNTTLRVLNVEQQRLGPQGAMVIAKMLETNRALREIRCSNNSVNLQAYTALVNAVEQNKTISSLPGLERDRKEQLSKLRRDLSQSVDADDPPPSRLSVHGSLTSTFHSLDRKRSLRSLRSFTGRLSSENEKTSSLSDLQVDDALRALNTRWDDHAKRLRDCLQQNSSAGNLSRVPTPIPILINAS